MPEAGDLGDRVRSVTNRALAAPARVEWLYANQEAVNEGLRQLTAAVADLVTRLDRIEDGGRGGVTAVGDEIHRLRGVVASRLDEIEAILVEQAEVSQRVAATASRDAEFARLIEQLGPRSTLRPGLSVFTTCWNHGGVLGAAAASALAALDALPDGHVGQLLIVNDASSDETPAVAADLAGRDPRVRVITAGSNLGSARARNVMLHVVETSHAFQLDADNTAAPAGVATVYEVARRFDSAFTYGNVLKVLPDGSPAGVISNEPITEAWLRNNYVDTMGVVDVARLRALGGWVTDPTVEHMDDWAMVHRLARAGELIGFVPVVAGRYRARPASPRLTPIAEQAGPRRVARTFNFDGRLSPERIAAFAGHPLTGVLWSTPAAQRLNPELTPVEPSRTHAPARPKLLMIGPGGVDNVGDDAIGLAVSSQLVELASGYDIDLVTDGPAPLTVGQGAVWPGTLLELVWALAADELPDDETIAKALLRIPRPADAWPARGIELAGYDAAVFAGGGSLTSLWSDSLVCPRAVVAAALGRLGVPYLASGQGLGPLDAPDLELARLVVGGAVTAGVRDHASLALLGEAESASASVTVTGDDALLLEPADAQTVDKALAAAGIDGPYLAFTAREADYVSAGASDEAGLERWATAVDAEAHRRGIAVLCVALNDHVDAPEILTLARLAHGGKPRSAPWYVITCDRNPTLLAGVMAGADAVIAHSYHAALFGLRAGVPSLLVAGSPYYRAKAEGLSQLAGLGDAVVALNPDSAEIERQLAASAEAIASGAGLASATAAVADWWRSAVPALLGAGAQSSRI